MVTVTASGRGLATPTEVADYLTVSERTLTQWRYVKSGPRWSKVGRHVRYRWADVEKWLDEQAGSAAA